jgi:WD40 repeat protein
MGVYPHNSDGTDINSVDANEDRTLVVSGDDFGSLNIFRYPILNSNHQSIRLIGHSEHVVRARFVKDSEFLVTVGGND